MPKNDVKKPVKKCEHLQAILVVSQITESEKLALTSLMFEIYASSY